MLEYAAPFLKVGGRLYAYQGPKWKQFETDGAQRVCQALSLVQESVISYIPREGYEERYLVIFRKVAPISAEYPRSVGVPKQTPIQ